MKRDRREIIVTSSVSTSGLQKRQSNKGKLSSNEVVKSPRLHIEHMIHMIKQYVQTRTFLVAISIHHLVHLARLGSFLHVAGDHRSRLQCQENLLNRTGPC